MSALTLVSIVLGSCLVVLFAPFVFLPDMAAEWIRRLPRSKIAAWLLTSAAFAWSAWLLYSVSWRFQMPVINRMVDFEQWRPWIFVITPLLIWLVGTYLDELLAARALGGLFLLIPDPLLVAARWHESEWRLVVTSFAYVLVVIGIVLMLSPHMFRKASAPLVRSSLSCRICGLTGCVFGLVLILLGAFVY
jgi:uncharacterized protein YjeT (DUF2065 family)